MPFTSSPQTIVRALRSMSLAALLAAAATTGAQAALVNVDFNTTTSSTFSGAALLGDVGDGWNGVAAGTLGGVASVSNRALFDAAGNATSALLSFTENSGAYDTAGELGCLFNSTLMCDYMYAIRKTITLTVDGLTEGDLFDLVLYSSANAPGRTSTFKLGNTTKTTVAATGAVFTEGVNYARFTGTVGTGGILSFDLIGGSGATEGNLNGFQLNLSPGSQIPEPTSISLVLAALSALALKRVRRRS